MAKLKYSYVKESFEQEGYALLSTDYINNSSSLKYKCPNNHLHSIIWTNWIKGARCPHCAGCARKTISYVKQEFEKEGYRLLNQSYINAHTLLDFICNKGHKHQITWNKWTTGKRCFYCHGTPKYTDEFVRQEFATHGLAIPDNWIYEGVHTPIPFICNKGHSHQRSYDNFRKSPNCLHCYYEQQSVKVLDRRDNYGVSRVVRRTLDQKTGHYYDPFELTVWVINNISEDVFWLYITFITES